MNYDFAHCRYCDKTIRTDAVTRTGWTHVDQQGFTDLYCDFRPMAVPRIEGTK